MVKAVVLAVLFLNAAQGASAVEPAPGAADGKAEKELLEMPAAGYRAAEPVIEFVKRTRPGAVPVASDRFNRFENLMVNGVLVLTAIFSGYLALQNRKASKGVTVHAKSGSNHTRGTKRTAAKEEETVPKLPATPRELAQHLKDRRDFHAAAVERLFKRI